MKTKKRTNTFLPLNLQYFAEPTEPQEPTNPEPPANEPTEPQEPNNKHMIPKTRFDQVNERAKAAEAALQKIKDEEAERQRKAQEEQGKFEELYNEASGKAKQFEQEYETAKEKAERLEGVMNSMLESKLQVIPDEYHDLIPENLSPEQKLDWISKAEAKGLFKDTSQEPLGDVTNPAQPTEDLNDLSVNQLFQRGYKN